MESTDLGACFDDVVAPPLEPEEEGATLSLETAPQSALRAGTPVRRAPWAVLFLAVLAAHVALVFRFGTPDQNRARIHKPWQVEIQVTRPPPPVPPPPPPPPTAAPSPPKVAASPLAHPKITPPEPVHASAGDPEPGLATAPPGDTGDVVAGQGEVGVPVETPAPAPPPPPPPAPVVAAKEGANYLKNPRPAYPRIARREGWQGSVLLRVRVMATGRPDGITVQKSSGRGILDDAAVDAVKSWTFAPATRGGNPVVGWVNVPIEFQLQ